LHFSYSAPVRVSVIGDAFAVAAARDATTGVCFARDAVCRADWPVRMAAARDAPPCVTATRAGAAVLRDAALRDGVCAVRDVTVWLPDAAFRVTRAVLVVAARDCVLVMLEFWRVVAFSSRDAAPAPPVQTPKISAKIRIPFISYEMIAKLRISGQVKYKNYHILHLRARDAKMRRHVRRGAK